MNVCSFVVHLNGIFFNYGKMFIYKTIIFVCSVEQRCVAWELQKKKTFWQT
jgi:hypothetical protein